MEIRRAGEVRIRVEGHVDAVGARGVDHREQLGRPAAVHRVAEVGVREVERHSGATDDLDAGGVRLERVEAVVAVMRGVEPTVLSHDLAELDELVVRGVHARRVRKACGEPDGPLLEPFGQESLHVKELVGRRGAIVEPHRDHAERAVRDEVRGVDRDPLVEPVEELAHRPPAPVESRGIVVPGGELRAQLLEHLVASRARTRGRPGPAPRA